MLSEQNGHILVVDDNRLNRLTLARSLEQQGHIVALAENGRQALEMVRVEPFDVVLLDIVMPGLDGFAGVGAHEGGSGTARHPRDRHLGRSTRSRAPCAASKWARKTICQNPSIPCCFVPGCRPACNEEASRSGGRLPTTRGGAAAELRSWRRLGKLSAGMAHELNNPAAAVQRSAGPAANRRDPAPGCAVASWER